MDWETDLEHFMLKADNFTIKNRWKLMYLFLLPVGDYQYRKLVFYMTVGIRFWYFSCGMIITDD